jgi:hypothetical protein
MVDDISNKTIVVLVILTVIISILGTLTVLSETGNIKGMSQQPAISKTSSSSSGQVSLGIVENKPLSSSSTGYVTIGIV